MHLVILRGNGSSSTVSQYSGVPGLGGFASFFGPLLGAFVFIFLQDTVMSVFPYWRLVFGAVLAFLVICAPGGLMGLFARRPVPLEPERG